MTAGAHRAPAVPRAERGRHRAQTAEQLLGEYRRWAMLLVGMIVYVLLVMPVGYYDYGMHDPWFVFPNVGILLILWGVVAKTLHTWDRHVAARDRARRAPNTATSRMPKMSNEAHPETADAPAQITCAGAPGLT